jgi:hypothetical protein
LFLKRRAVLGLVLVLIVLGLTRLAPTYTYVRVSGPDGEVEVEQFRFGPQQTTVKQGDSRVKASAW